MKAPPGIASGRRAQNSSEIKKTAAAPVLPRLSAIGEVWSSKIGFPTRNMKPVAEKTQKKQRCHARADAGMVQGRGPRPAHDERLFSWAIN